MKLNTKNHLGQKKFYFIYHFPLNRTTSLDLQILKSSKIYNEIQLIYNKIKTRLKLKSNL